MLDVLGGLGGDFKPAQHVLGQFEINHRAHRARKAAFLGDLGGLGGDPP
jgi:hypothetical protein